MAGTGGSGGGARPNRSHADVEPGVPWPTVVRVAILTGTALLGGYLATLAWTHWLATIRAFSDGGFTAAASVPGGGWAWLTPAALFGVLVACAFRGPLADWIAPPSFLFRVWVGSAGFALAVLTGLGDVLATSFGSAALAAAVTVGVPAGAGLLLFLRRLWPAGPVGWGGRVPQPGEVWWAYVRYDEGRGGKDRPCLVLEAGKRSATVLKITSQDKSGRDGFAPMPTYTWDPAGAAQGKVSWLDLSKVRRVPATAFRRPAGPCEPFTWERVNVALSRR